MSTHSRRFRHTLFLMIYFVQGAILNYFLNYNSTYLKEVFGIGEGAIGALGAVLMIPFLLKIFIGMLSDRVNLFGMGHRKPYMIIGLLVQAGGFFLIPFVSPVEARLLFVLAALLAVSGMALYDTTTDGYALDTTPPEERGAVQSVMVTGRALGLAVLTPLIGIGAARWGWGSVFTVGALITLLPLALVVRIREDPAARSPDTFQWSAFRAFGSGRVLLFSLFGIIAAIVIMSLPPFLNLYFTSGDAPYLGIGLRVSGWVFFIMGMGRILGALVAGRMTDRLGIRASAWVCLAMTGTACFGIAAVTGYGLDGLSRPVSLAAAPVVALVFFGILLSAGYSYYDTIYFCGAMRFAEPAVYASMYAIFMAIGNIGQALGSPLAGSISGHPRLGFPVAALVIGLINLVNIPLVLRVFEARPPRTKGAANAERG